MSADPTRAWSAATRILECDATSLDVLRALVARGCGNALALARPERLAALRAEAGELAPKLAPWTDARQALANNADVLVLSGASSEVLWSRRSLTHLQQILAPPSAKLHVPLLARRVAGLLTARGKVELGGARWSVHDVRCLRKVRARYYLSPELGAARFFAELERRRVRWLVLRWWEELPDKATGDIDLLVHDDDAPQFLEALGGRVGTLPLDVYAVHGSRGMAFGGACYYPSELAKRMLERSELNARGVRVPCREDAFFSLAFHALYHKGPKSGLATAQPGVAVERAPKHDFARLLPARARELGLAVEPTMEALDALLGEHGWRPPRDTLRKWANKNPWVRARWFQETAHREKPGWCVFVVRRRALECGLVDAVEREVRGHGFHVLAREPLDDLAAERFRRHARGGNWGKDDYPVEGGAPALFLIAFDPAPKRTRRRFARRYPDMDNGRIVAKRAIRDAVNAALPEAERANFLHTSDNSDEAWEYVRLAWPERVEALRRELGERAAKL